MPDNEIKQIRLNKFISESGFCSRREADQLIKQGRVTLNGIIPDLGTKVLHGDKVLVDNKLITSKKKHVYIAFNKPIGVTCTTERHIKGNIIDYINHPERIFPIGRLDKASEGLIFLTSDGDIVNKILRSENNHEKEYLVTVNKLITADFIKKMSDGILILDTITKRCTVKQENSKRFRIILTQGLNRQIRRMCQVLDYQVLKLKRVRIMKVNLTGINSGQWRYLTPEEILIVNEKVAYSVKTEEVSLSDYSE
ncbi:MAG: pseudouridine synthase [Flavobacterium sp.]|nr:pseudouridine synthase [Pedobacter sp.]